MHERAFEALKRTFMHVSRLPPPYFDKKPIYKVIVSFFKTCWGKT